MLFGERDDAAGVIWVDEISGPPPDSVETPELFLCGTDGVLELDDYKRKRSHGSVRFLGMWHTHPNQSADFSSRDLRGMVELLDAARSPQAQGLVLIVGWRRRNRNSPAMSSSVNSCDPTWRRLSATSTSRWQPTASQSS